MLLGPPILNPEIPLITKLPVEKIEPGFLILLEGKVPSIASRFEIDLACGPEMKYPGMSDVAFHLNPRFKTKQIVRNSLKNDAWGFEENKYPHENPFKKDKNFEIMILVELHQYKVAVNGVHLLEFNHRIPIDCVNTLHIIGDVEINKIEFMQTAVKISSNECQTQLASSMKSEILNPSVPFCMELPDKLKVGTTFFISGKPSPFAQRFIINLESRDRSVVYFHFNPRIDGTDKGVVVRNSFNCGSWQEEERTSPYFPFKINENFDLAIRCEEKEFLVAVNGKHFVTFRHRMPFQQIEIFSVSSDVVLGHVKIH